MTVFSMREEEAEEEVMGNTILLERKSTTALEEVTPLRTANLPEKGTPVLL